MAKKISGIYRIVCVKNERYYYGSSMNVRARWEYHKRKLRRQTHTNPVVQRVWNKHGEQSFHIEFVEKVDSDKLLEAEQHYLNEHVGKSKCMNISKDAIAIMKGRHHSEKTKQLLSVRSKERMPFQLSTNTSFLPATFRGTRTNLGQNQLRKR